MTTQFKVVDGELKYGNRKLETFRSLYDFAVGTLNLDGASIEQAVSVSTPTEVDPRGLYAIATKLNNLLTEAASS